MKIAVLGWGSLIWDQRELKITDDKWYENGPVLPIEFARISKDGRLTLVIKPSYPEVAVLYGISTFLDINVAVENLRLREGTSTKRVGWYNFHTCEKNIRTANEPIIIALNAWKQNLDIDAVIWTDLPPNFQDSTEQVLNLENIAKVLYRLKRDQFIRAKEYLDKAPKQITTKLRPEISQLMESLQKSYDLGDTIDMPKNEVLFENLSKYSKSLAAHPDKYLHLFFANDKNIPEHYAYICPICVQQGILSFDDSYTVSTKTGLTLDHYPPESVGGDETILVCRTCNSKAGSGYEYVLSQKISESAFNSLTTTAVSKVKTEISGVKGRYSSTISVGKDGKMIISFKPNSKAHTPLLDQWLEKSTDDLSWTAQITIPSADEQKVSMALLKTAYLFCFESWGYEFVFSNTGKFIRDILNGKAEYPLQNPSFWIGDAVKNGQLHSLPIGLCYLQQPRDWKLFIVNIILKDLDTGYENVVSVLIPGPETESWSGLYEIKKMLDSQNDITLSMAHITENLLSYGIIDGYTKNWDMVKSPDHPK